ncbi:unnamed protein product [Ilex paraguariensis]|uniref:Uncharacterized protein n=1 Tax=Ilex paraguariensis TaxID=185542 RepID=A0ABC8QWG1_9AQUA
MRRQENGSLIILPQLGPVSHREHERNTSPHADTSIDPKNGMCLHFPTKGLIGDSQQGKQSEALLNAQQKTFRNLSLKSQRRYQWLRRRALPRPQPSHDWLCLELSWFSSHPDRGLCLYWRKYFDVQIVLSTPFIISAQLPCERTDKGWLLNCVYAPANRMLQSKLWDTISEINEKFQGPYLYIGDFKNVTS